MVEEPAVALDALGRGVVEPDAALHPSGAVAPRADDRDVRARVQRRAKTCQPVRRHDNVAVEHAHLDPARLAQPSVDRCAVDEVVVDSHQPATVRARKRCELPAGGLARAVVHDHDLVRTWCVLDDALEQGGRLVDRLVHGHEDRYLRVRRDLIRAATAPAELVPRRPHTTQIPRSALLLEEGAILPARRAFGHGADRQRARSARRQRPAAGRRPRRPPSASGRPGHPCSRAPAPSPPHRRWTPTRSRRRGPSSCPAVP